MVRERHLRQDTVDNISAKIHKRLGKIEILPCDINLAAPFILKHISFHLQIVLLFQTWQLILSEYTGCISKNLTLYKNNHWIKLIFGKWSPLLILQLQLSLGQNKVKNGNILKFLSFKPVEKKFFQEKILTVRLLLIHPVWIATTFV